MSDVGEKTCPLCAEEMDLTDQQLKPCKCGYDICVWCWHHIMDVAEKDESEGRCPACRNPYDKEKIVGTAASRGSRLVSEMNVEKKVKSQKGKNKTSEGRKQLANVRVIQRNLVYVAGLALDFADEDQLLQRKEYFGQYGKVLKVSISRTTGGAIQQFPNSTCSVYITYSKEEEAVRCIQSVHGFVLDGRPLRACFGTTKYCHSWLRNVPCSNPDCLYLHEIGSHEDSFTKDETVSAYTRIQQFTGSSNSMQRRSGNMLPPPMDDHCNNDTASLVNPVSKSAVNINSSSVSTRLSPPNSISVKSAALPAGASWGTRLFSNQPSLANTPVSNGPLKQKSDLCNSAVAGSAANQSPSQVSSLHSGSGKIFVPDEESTVAQDKMDSLEPVKNEWDTVRRIYDSDSTLASLNSATLHINRQHSDAPSTKLHSYSNNLVDSLTPSSVPTLGRCSVDVPNGNIENVCSDILSMSIHENQQLENVYVEHNRETLTSHTFANTTEEVLVTNVQSDSGLGRPTEATQVALHEIEDDLLSFDNQRLKDPEVSINQIPDHSHALHLSKHSILSPQFNNGDVLIPGDFDRQIVNRNSNLVISTSDFPTERPQGILNSSEVNDVEYSNLIPNKERTSLLGRYNGDVSTGASNMGESSIILNILSMDFDPWDESSTSPQNLSNLVGETERRRGTFGVPGPRKSQNSNQSRFSFAREEPMSQVSGFGQSMDYFEQGFKHRPSDDFRSSNGIPTEKFVPLNGFHAFSDMESNIFSSNHSHISSNKLSVSRSQIAAPPGFSMPSRPPPPGFTSRERTEQILDTLSGNHRFDSSSCLRDQYRTHSSCNNTINNSDIEFMDPAILAVGKGTLPVGITNMRSSFSPQLSTYEESRFQSFLQKSLPQHQNQRYNDALDGFAPLGDAYGISSRIMEQRLNNNLSPYSQFNLPQHRSGITSNGQWNGWNEGQNGNNNFGMAELLRNDGFGYNNFNGGYEDPKIRMSSSGNLYNGAYGI